CARNNAGTRFRKSDQNGAWRRSDSSAVTTAEENGGRYPITNTCFFSYSASTKSSSARRSGETRSVGGKLPNAYFTRSIIGGISRSTKTQAVSACGGCRGDRDWGFVEREMPPIIDRVKYAFSNFPPTDRVSPERL